MAIAGSEDPRERGWDNYGEDERKSEGQSEKAGEKDSEEKEEVAFCK